MYAVLCPVIAHELEHLEYLTEMQVLLVCDDIKGFAEIIGIVAIFCRSKVACRIDGASVAALYDAGRHIVLGEIDDSHAVIYLGNALILKLFDNSRHLILIEGFTVVAVKGYAEKVICPRNILEGQLFEPFKKLPLLGTMQLDAVERLPCRIVEARILIRFLMEFDI